MPLACSILCRYITFLLAIACPFLSHATPYYFDHIIDAQGEPIRSVRSIIEDQQGFLWLGGDAGIHRFDGYNAKQLNKKATRGLYQDKSGRFWSAGTITLSALERNTFMSIAYPNLSNHLKKPDYEVINHMLQTSQGRHFFATNEGLSEYIQITDSFIHHTFSYEDEPSVAVTALLNDKSQRLWLGTAKGLFEISLNQLPQQSVHIELSDAVISLASISDIKSATNGELLIGTNNGLYRLNPSNKRLRHFNHIKGNSNSLTSNNVTRVLVDAQQQIWIGTSYGLNVLSQNGIIKRLFHDEQNPTSLSNNLITDIFEDQNDNILIATYSGIDRFHYKDVHLTKAQPTTHDGQSINNVWSLHQDGPQDLWIGTFGSGLIHTNKQQTKGFTNDVNDPHSLISNRVSSLFIDASNRLLVGTTKGVQVYDRQLQQFNTIKLIDETTKKKSIGTVFDITQHPNGEVWLATNSGIIQLTQTLKLKAVFNKTSTPNIQYEQWVRAVLPLHEHILVGTDKGLFVMDLADNTTTKIKYISGVLKIFQDSLGKIWLLSNEGVRTYDPISQTIKPIKLFTNVFGQSTPSDGSCNAMAQDALKQLWIVCQEGIKIVSLISQKLIASYSKYDGADLSGFLTGSQSMIGTMDGKLLFGLRSGVGQITPSLQQRQARQAKAVITQVNFSNETSDLGSVSNPFDFALPRQQSLPYNLQKVEFQFSALDLARPSSSGYQYQLSGYEQSWTDTNANNRRAIYTNLPGGNYTFKLKAFVEGKGTKTTQYPFTIATKPWKSWWAYLIYLLLSICAIYGLIYLRTNALRIRSEILTKSVAERTSELVLSKKEIEQLMQEREKLIENILHQTRTPLQIMLGNINALVNNELTMNQYAQKQMIKVNDLVHLTDQILDVSRVTSTNSGPLRQVDLSALIRPLILSFSDVAIAKGLQFESTIDDSIIVQGLPNSLENAIDNVIANSIKYTDVGQIKISIVQQDNTVIIQCSDTGIGIPEQEQSKIFTRYHRAYNATARDGAGIGLAMVKDVIDAHNGHIELSSQMNKGTTIKISLPTIEQNDSLAQQEYLTLDSKACTPDNPKNEVLPTILVVEDNLELASYLAKLLAPSYRVLTALNGEAGLKEANKSVPDIIISDVMMSPMNGYELTKKIRNDEITCHIPILLVTAKSDDASKEHGFSLGANDFITKPFKALDLLNRVANQLTQITAIQTRAERSQTVVAELEEDRLITRYLQFIAKNYQNNELKIKDVCQSLHISIRQLERKVRHFLDMTPNELLNDYRLSRATKLIKQGHKVSDVYNACGFSSHAYFTKRYKEKFGYLPSEHKNDKKKPIKAS